MDRELILEAAGAEAPGLLALASRFLEAEAAGLGVSLDPADVVARRSEGAPEVHITAAADELVMHLLGADEGVLGDEKGTFMMRARSGAWRCWAWWSWKGTTRALGP